MNKKVVITGCTGQDGSYMADYLLEKGGFSIFAMVRRVSTPNYINIKHLLDNPNFHIVTGDLSDSSSIEGIVSNIKPDYFINFAAQSFVGDSWKIPEQTVDSGGVGPLRCLEAIWRHAPACRFYNAGSSEQFGNVDYSPQDEKHPFKPRSQYAVGKCTAHFTVKVYRESYPLYAVQGILFNHESERRGPEFVTRKITQGVARIVKAIAKGQTFNPIELGNLDAKRDWSHALDFIDGVWKMLNQDEPNDYVLASGETHSIREFVEKAFNAAGVAGQWMGEGLNEKYMAALVDYDGVTRPISLVEVNEKFYRPAEVDLLLGDASLARAKLGWKPKISFDELVERMVRYDLNV